MKRLIVCCDGTWNTPDQEDNGIPAPTNVFKLHNAVDGQDAQGNVQLKYYHPGVGAEGGLFDSVLGGAMGVGVGRHICSAYHWLGTNYEPGDEIFLFGFSRGAFTVRSLGGFLGRGLLDLRGLDPNKAWARVHAAYEKGYRTKDSKPRDWVEKGWTFFHQAGPKQPLPAPVRFIGVWDTVGALGVPDDLEIMNLLDQPDNWRFHDTELGMHVQSARHAMAIDEIRACFTVTRWTKVDPGRDVRELWFPGVHSDVGGGYSDCCLADAALHWMMTEAAGAGLALRANAGACLRPNPLGPMHNSYKGAFAKLRSRPRNIPAMTPENAALFAQSALDRQAVSPIAYPPYHPTRILENVGDAATVEVFADTHWNATGIYLEAGREYTFSGEGQWMDSKDACAWTGTQDNKLTFGDVTRAVGSFLGVFENIFKNLHKNSSTDFLGTKRVEEFKWFTMVGAIANDSGQAAAATNDGSPCPHEYVDLAAHTTDPLQVSAPGYLYCFANDAWGLYGNNHGSVQLTIRRVK